MIVFQGSRQDASETMKALDPLPNEKEDWVLMAFTAAKPGILNSLLNQRYSQLRATILNRPVHLTLALPYLRFYRGQQTSAATPNDTSTI